MSGPWLMWHKFTVVCFFPTHRIRTLSQLEPTPTDQQRVVHHVVGQMHMSSPRYQAVSAKHCHSMCSDYSMYLLSRAYAPLVKYRWYLVNIFPFYWYLDYIFFWYLSSIIRLCFWFLGLYSIFWLEASVYLQPSSQSCTSLDSDRAREAPRKRGRF